jgi:membrane protease YdiL (CAAX protease family)
MLLFSLGRLCPLAYTTADTCPFMNTWSAYEHLVARAFRHRGAGRRVRAIVAGGRIEICPQMRKGGKLRQESQTRWQQRWARLMALLVVAALMPWPLLLTHDNWWAFVLVTSAIVAALRLLLGRQWADYAGLKLPPTHVLIVVAAFAVVATGSEMLLPIVYKAAGLKANAPTIEEQIGFVFQAFNEEIFFRALMIGFFIQYVRSALTISLGLAFLFAAAHFLLYRFGTLHMALSTASLATLFFAGVAWNNLYLAFRHIGFSWALHAGWNVVWLAASFYDASTNERLYEPQVFDRVLGSQSSSLWLARSQS